MPSDRNHTAATTVASRSEVALTGAQSGLDREAEFDLLTELAETALRQARDLGADQAEVLASSQRGLSVNVRLGEVETLENTQDRGVTVTLYRGQRKGTASCGDLTPTRIREAVSHANDIARFTETDRYAGLAAAELMAADPPDLDLWHPAAFDAEYAIADALACEAAGRDFDARITNSDGASAGGSANLTVYANSHGFVGRRASTRYSRSCAFIGSDEGGMQSGYWYDSNRVLERLEAAAATGRKAARRTVERLGARPVKTARVPVLFVPEIARTLISHLVSAVSGGNLYRKASFLQDRLGDVIFPEWLRIGELPHLTAGPGSAAFDADGVATRESLLVEDGRLLRYVLSSYSARRLGMETTANAGGVHNLRVLNDGPGFDEMVAGMPRGMIVTEVMGQGVNIVTGNYSRGASGFWVEDGEIVQPVEEVTIAGNLAQMFTDIQAVGGDRDVRSGIQTGSILVAAMTVAGE